VQQSITRLYASHGAQLIDESAPLAPNQPAHLRSAVQMEHIVRSLEQMAWVILRGGVFYGAGTGSTERLIAQARSGAMRLEGDGNQYMSPVHPQDMARAVVLAVESLPSRTTFNVVDDEPLPQREFFAAVRGMVNPDAVLLEADPSTAMPSRRCSNAKLRSCGFVPAFPTCRHGLAAQMTADQGWRER
jgi:nucleoside-diphosphate-sugar epimerase